MKVSLMESEVWLIHKIFDIVPNSVCCLVDRRRYVLGAPHSKIDLLKETGEL